MHNPTPTPILFLITGLGVGGAETQLVRLVTNLDQTQWRPAVVSMTPPVAFQDQLEQAGVPVLSLEMTKGRPSLAALWSMVKTLRRYRPAILVCFMFHANLLGRLAGLVARVPVVISSVRTEHFGSRWREITLRLTDRLGETTVTNSRLVAESLVRRKVVPAGRVTVIPNALPQISFEVSAVVRQQTREKFGIAPDHFLWLAVGRLDPAKDYPTLLTAFAKVTGRHPRARLLVAGGGSLHETLQEQINALQIGEQVQLLGSRSDVPDLLAAADAYVLSSAWEGFPNGLMEAMAAAKPVVATTVGGVPELVTEGVTGHLVPPASPDELAAAIVRVMDTEVAIRSAMAARAQHFVVSHFGLPHVTNLWDELFRTYCHER